MIKVQCYLCGSHKYTERRGTVRDRKDLKIYECVDCGLVFLSSMEHIDNNFYEQSGMHAENIRPQEVLNRTIQDDTRRYIQLKQLIKDKKILDFGCGYGGFLLQAQEVAEKVYGVELEKKAVDFCVENNIAICAENNIPKVDMITMFHVIEHLIDPIEELKKIKDYLAEGGTLILETPNANDALLQMYKSKGFENFTYWGCHVFLYNADTLSMLAEKAGFKVEKVEQIQRYPLSNHLYWLANEKPGGDKVWTDFNDELLNERYKKILETLGMCDTILITLKK